MILGFHSQAAQQCVTLSLIACLAAALVELQRSPTWLGLTIKATATGHLSVACSQQAMAEAVCALEALLEIPRITKTHAYFSPFCLGCNRELWGQVFVVRMPCLQTIAHLKDLIERFIASFDRATADWLGS